MKKMDTKYVLGEMVWVNAYSEIYVKGKLVKLEVDAASNGIGIVKEIIVSKNGYILYKILTKGNIIHTYPDRYIEKYVGQEKRVLQ